MKLPLHMNNVVLLIMLSGLMTFFLLDIQDLSQVKQRVKENQMQLESQVSRYKAAMYQKYNAKTLIEKLEKKLSTSVTILRQHEELALVFETTKNSQDLLAAFNQLNQFLGPINELSIDFLNQSIELRLPLR